MKRLLCWLLSHRWRITAGCHRMVNLGHLHPLAGCSAVCTRCGEEWEDRCDGAISGRGCCA